MVGGREGNAAARVAVVAVAVVVAAGSRQQVVGANYRSVRERERQSAEPIETPGAPGGKKWLLERRERAAGGEWSVVSGEWWVVSGE